MNKFRYTEKEILCKYDLSEEFFSKLGIEIEDIVPLRKVFVITTTEGKKILKISNSNKERLEFIDKSLSYVSRKYKNILSYHRSKNGNIYEEWNGNIYVLLDMIEGREVTFNNPVEIEMCTEAIAQMHEASIGISKELGNDTEKTNFGVYLPQYYQESYKTLLSLKEHVDKFVYKNEFDKLFLDNVDDNLRAIEKSKELLAMSDYKSVLTDESKLVLCHNDLAHHNFIVDGDTVKLIDFDYCNIDTRIIDIANYANKVIKGFEYDMDKFKIIIDSYNKLQKLTKEEMKILYCILNFPRDFITIVMNYYYKEKAWEEKVFISRFNNKISNEIYRSSFLEAFKEEFKEYFY